MCSRCVRTQIIVIIKKIINVRLLEVWLTIKKYKTSSWKTYINKYTKTKGNIKSFILNYIDHSHTNIRKSSKGNTYDNTLMIWTLPEAFELLGKARQYMLAKVEPGKQKQEWIPGVYGHLLPIQAAAHQLELQRPFEPSAPSTSKKPTDSLKVSCIKGESFLWFTQCLCKCGGKDDQNELR